jgi:hypothetical protein
MMFDIFPYSTTNMKIMHLLVVREHLCVLLLAQRGFMLFGCWLHPNISSVEAILLLCSGDALTYFWEVNASVGVNLKAQEELWKLKYFTMLKHNLQKNSLKETKILQDIITLELVSSFNTSQNISSSKHPHIKIDL